MIGYDKRELFRDKVVIVKLIDSKRYADAIRHLEMIHMNTDSQDNRNEVSGMLFILETIAKEEVPS